MNEKDCTEKILADCEDVFADIVNVLLFNGKKIIQPEDLESLPTKSVYKSLDGTVHEEERDIVKYWKQKGIRIAVCGFEHQTKPHDFMPARIIAYDGANYRSQLLKNSREVLPVVTLVLYFGIKHWDKPVTLKDLFHDVPEELEPYINDYRINLFEIAWLDDETIEKFQSDFKIVARHFAELRKDQNYMPKGMGKPDHVDELLKLFKAVTGDDRYEKAIALTEEGETVDQALENLWQHRLHEVLNQEKVATYKRCREMGMTKDKALLIAGLSEGELLESEASGVKSGECVL